MFADSLVRGKSKLDASPSGVSNASETSVPVMDDRCDCSPDCVFNYPPLKIIYLTIMLSDDDVDASQGGVIRSPHKSGRVNREAKRVHEDKLFVKVEKCFEKSCSR
ncbi:hypothetical protein Tco_0863776 [Tanacetum coccineum]